ncbi:MAG TPA: RodZ domain-containing protein [Thermodesulfobacteriota bacterium]|nr:RodZ domain-containing protein [Thermodesulfobacteriota bacterium]
MDERETLGSYLKNLRESKRISLKEVAKITRVRENTLRAIEEDQHHLLPPPTYVKGFLLAYAKYLKLDPNDVLVRYEKGLKGESVAPAPPQPPKPIQKVSPAQPKKKILWNTRQTWVVVGVIVASLIIFYFFSPYPSKPPVVRIPEKPISQEKSPIVPSSPLIATAPVQKEKPVAEVKPSPAPSLPVAATTLVLEKKPVSLKLKAVEEAWVSLQVDDEPQKEMTLKPGQGISVQASNRIRMILGNAGGTELILNGKELERFGKSGEVVTLTLTPQGVEVKHHEQPKSPKEEIPNSKPESSN